jgi:hypothetical protein
VPGPSALVGSSGVERRVVSRQAWPISSATVTRSTPPRTSWVPKVFWLRLSVGVEGPPLIAGRRCGIESGSGSVLGRAEQIGDLCPGPLHAPGVGDGDGERQAPLGLGDEVGEQVNVAGVIEERSRRSPSSATASSINS